MHLVCVCRGEKSGGRCRSSRSRCGGSCAAVRRDGVSPGGYRHCTPEEQCGTPPPVPCTGTSHQQPPMHRCALCLRLRARGAAGGLRNRGRRHWLAARPAAIATEARQRARRPPPACPLCRDAPTAAPRTALSACGCDGTRPHGEEFVGAADHLVTPWRGRVGERHELTVCPRVDVET